MIDLEDNRLTFTFLELARPLRERLAGILTGAQRRIVKTSS